MDMLKQRSLPAWPIAGLQYVEMKLAVIFMEIVDAFKFQSWGGLS
jgi:hypothetical protein